MPYLLRLKKAKLLRKKNNQTTTQQQNISNHTKCTNINIIIFQNVQTTPVKHFRK